MIHVLAVVELHPGSREAFLAEFRKVMPQVHAEAGCLEYGPAVDAETDLPQQQPMGEDTVVIIEKWESLAALRSHLAAEHMVAYREKVKPFVRHVRLHVLRPA